jgi:hypothetical protein
MEFLHASIALLASMVLVLAGMVGWLYWQQTRLFQNMNSIVMVIGELARPHPPSLSLAVPEEEEVVPKKEEEPLVEDDRASVEEEETEEPKKSEIIEGPPGPIDTDGLEDKTTKELKDMLTKRGIPFGKRDSKSVLISLLKATA